MSTLEYRLILVAGGRVISETGWETDLDKIHASAAQVAAMGLPENPAIEIRESR